MFDVVTIGSATRDIFIESDKSKILTLKGIEEKKDLLCFGYGDKIEIDQHCFDIGGGAINTAVNFANLGFKTSTVVKTGNGLNGKAVVRRLKEYGVDSSLIIKSDALRTGFSVILTSFEGDRTVLTHRGANAQMFAHEIDWDKVKSTKWIYIASLSKQSNDTIIDIADFAAKNNIHLAFNPGGTSIRKGLGILSQVLKSTDVLVMNKTEASDLTKIIEKPESKHDFNDGKVDLIPFHISQMLNMLFEYVKKVVFITDGKHGVYGFDGEYYYQCDTISVKVASTLGAGDAFSSTLVAALSRYDWDIEKALPIATLNAASVVEHYGAQEGLKTVDELNALICKYPELVVKKVSAKL